MNKNTKRRLVTLRRQLRAGKIENINRSRREAIPNAPVRSIVNPNANEV